MGTEARIEHLRDLRDEALHAGTQRAVARQHEAGKLTARERIEALLDQGSFQEIDQFVRHQSTGFGIEDKKPLGDAVVTGHGTVEGRPVFVFAEDFTVFGGSLGTVVADKTRMMVLSGRRMSLLRGVGEEPVPIEPPPQLETVQAERIVPVPLDEAREAAARRRTRSRPRAAPARSRT